MITIYEANARDFATLGLGALTPAECTIEEKAGGLYELKLVHPMTTDLRHELLRQMRIIKAPAPVRETPLLTLGKTGETVARDIYRIETVSGRRLYLRVQPDQESRGIHAYKPGTEVVSLGLSEDGKWRNVVIADGGAAGWMWNGNLVFVRTETETIENDTPRGVVQPRQTREQLFRIVEIEQDSKLRTVTARAQHISYDLKGAIVTGEYSLEKVAADVVCAQLIARLDHEMPEFHVYCAVNTPVSGEYGGRNLLDCLLDPDTGIAAQANARVIRDNFDIFLLPFEERSRGVELRYGKNLLAAAQTTDTAGIITRIFPVGKDADGNKLRYTDADGRHYVDSSRISDYPVIYAKEIEYDVVVGDELKADDANTLLEEKARADFEAGCDLAGLGLTADFVRLDLTEKYKHLANAYALHMYDSVPVIDNDAGILATAQMTAYKYDGVLDRYSDTSLGSITDADVSVYGYEIANGSVAGSKIIPNSLGGDRLKNLSVGYGKFDVAAIRQLSADAIKAVRAEIHKLVAGEITTDELYADLATIAIAEITTADIDWAAITSLTAEMARIALAQITTANIDEANIDWAEIKELQAAIAEIAKANITEANINEANINWANIGTLTANIAKILAANVKAGDFEFADVEKLVAGAMILEQGVGGSVYIKNLAATQANFVSATLGELVLKGSDGKYYSVAVEADGTIRTEETTVTSDEAGAGQTAGGKTIVETSANIADLNAGTIKANSAIISDIFAGALEAGKVTAGEAFIASASIPELYITSLKALGDTIDISANRSIRLLVEKTMGRNYLLATGEAAEAVLSGESNYIAARYYLSVDCEELVGKTVTVSYEWTYEGDAPAGTLKLTEGKPSYRTWGMVTIAEGNTSGRFTRTSTVSEGSADVEYLYVRADGITGTVKISRMKLELGEEATGWAPAPEDLGETEKELRAELKVQADGFSAAVEAIEGAQTDIAELSVRSDGIETRVEDSEGKIAELEQTAEGLKTTIRDEVAGLQTQISETAEGVEILAGQVTGGTQLIRDTQLLNTGESSDADAWWIDDGITVTTGGDGFRRFEYEVSGATADIWTHARSPLSALPYGWIGREVTLSAWVWSDDWSLMEAGGHVTCALTLALSNGSVHRGFYDSRGIVNAAVTGWNSDVTANGSLGNRVWRRVWTTIRLAEDAFTPVTNVSYTFDDCTHIFVQLHLRRNGKIRFKAPKLEFGNVVTDWSAHPEEVYAGSSVSITKNEVSISTPKFEVNIPNSTGTKTMLSIDEQGVYGQSIIAPNIMQKYTGSGTLYVDPAATAAQMANGNYFRSLADACKAVNNKWLSSDVTINLAAGMTEYGTVTIRGIAGGGILKITGNSTNPAKLVGKLAIYSMGVRLEIKYLNTETASGESVHIKGGGAYVTLDHCELNGSASGATSHRGVMIEEGARVGVTNCAIYNFTRPIYANVLAMVYGQDNKGNATVATTGGIMMLTGTQPCGSATWTANAWGGGQVFAQGVTVDQGDYPSAAPAQPTTQTYYASTTHTYSPKTGWATSNDAVRQGYTKTVGQLRGCMWFSGLTALKGKSILNATLRLTRNSTQGVSYGVAIELWGTTMGSGMTGEPVLTKNYGTVVAGGSDDDTSRGIVWGETEAFTIPTAAISDIAAGTTSGLMIVSSDNSLYQSKVYSRNYAGFSGASAENGAKPMLTVVYQ